MRESIAKKADPYMTVEEIVEDIVARGDASERASWRSVTRDQVIEAHHGTGREIRNYFRLWEPENPYTRIDGPDLVIENGVITDPLFPDQVSNEVMLRLWDFYNGTTG